MRERRRIKGHTSDSLRVNKKLAVSQQQRKPHHFDEQCIINKLTYRSPVLYSARHGLKHIISHSRPQRPRSFWLAPRIATSGQVQHRKSAIHGLPVTLRMFRVMFDKSDWL